MTTTAQLSGSAPPEGTPKQIITRDWIAKISALSAIVAAILSAIVTLRVTNIQTDTQQLVSNRKDSVARAELFRDLIEDLNDPNKSGYALLTLWKIYDEPKDRKVVVLAALENPNQDTIDTLTRMGFEKELEGYSDTFARIARSGTGESADVAKNIILQALSPVSTARYLMDILASATIIEPHHPNVDSLITLSAKHTDVMALVAQQEKRVDQDRPLFAYIQYKAGNSSPFLQYLKDVQSDPKKFRAFIELMTKLTREDLDRRDWPQIIATAISFLAANEPGTRNFSEQKAFALIDRNNYGDVDLSDEQAHTIVELCYRFVHQEKTTDDTRWKALECLYSWDQPEMRQTVAEYLSCEGNFDTEKYMFTSLFLEDAVNDASVFKPPVPIASDSDAWRNWFEEHYPKQVLNCKR